MNQNAQQRYAFKEYVTSAILYELISSCYAQTKSQIITCKPVWQVKFPRQSIFLTACYMTAATLYKV